MLANRSVRQSRRAGASSEVSVGPSARLTHPRFQMRQVHRNAAAHIPNEIIIIPALDAALPVAAKHGMELAGEQAGKIVNADLVGRGNQAGVRSNW